MAWLRDSEKKFEDIFIRFGTIHERAGRTDRHTHRQTPHDATGRAYASHRAAKIRSMERQYLSHYRNTVKKLLPHAKLLLKLAI